MNTKNGLAIFHNSQDPTTVLSRRMHYAKHIDSLTRAKKTIETDTPKMF